MSGPQTLAEQYLRDHPEEAAAVLEGRLPEQVAAVLEDMPVEVAAGTLRRMTPSAAASSLERLSSARAAALGTVLPAGAFAPLLRRLDASARDAVLTEMDAEPANALRSLLRHPEDTAGGLMDPTVLVLPDDTSVDDAIRLLRRGARTTTYYLYVVDRDQRLVGVLTVRELLYAERQRKLADVMHSPVARLSALADRREILDHPGWRVHHALPVVDAEARFLGVIRYETVRDLEAELRRQENAPVVLDTALRLGELMWIALSGVFLGFAGPVVQSSESTDGRRDRGN